MSNLPSENPQLPDDYRERMRDALIQSAREDLVARLVKGRVEDVNRRPSGDGGAASL